MSGAHARSFAVPQPSANVNRHTASDTSMAARGAAQMSLLSIPIPELVGEEIHAWVDRERQARPGATAAMLMTSLARILGLDNERQVYRYMSGETPFPASKVVLLCRAIGSWKLLQAINQDGGLVAEPRPDVGRLDSFDLIVEQSRNLKEFGEFVSVYCDQMQRPPSAIEARRLEREGREVIQQIERLVRYARELADRAGARA